LEQPDKAKIYYDMELELIKRMNGIEYFEEMKSIGFHFLRTELNCEMGKSYVNQAINLQENMFMKSDERIKIIELSKTWFLFGKECNNKNRELKIEYYKKGIEIRKEKEIEMDDNTAEVALLLAKLYLQSQNLQDKQDALHFLKDAEIHFMSYGEDDGGYYKEIKQHKTHVTQAKWD